MEKEGSTAGFVLSLIGGILSILVGIGIIIKNIMGVYAIGFIKEQMDKSLIIIYFAVALYFLILGIWIIAAGYWMRKNISLKKGAVASLILGLISLNILAIIGGIFGLVESKKITPMQQTTSRI